MRADVRARILQAAGGLLLARAGLRLFGFRRWEAAIERLTRRAVIANGPDAQAQLELARAIERSIAAAARHLPLQSNCLDQALTLWWYLRRRGIGAKLCLGGRKAAGNFEAHAWVELGEAVFNNESGESAEFAIFEPANAAIERRAL